MSEHMGKGNEFLIRERIYYMRILVTGGHGFLGSRVLPLLRGDVFAPSREELDVTQLGSVEQAVEEYEPDIIVHMAAVVDEHSPDLWNVNVEGTRNVVLTAERFDIDHLVFTSTAGVYGDTGSTPATEDREPAPETLYERSKLAAESYVRKSTVPHTILRLALIVGPNRYWEQLFSLVAKGFPIIGSGRQVWQLLDVDDAASAVAFAVKKKLKGTYNVAGEDSHEFNEIYRMMAAAMGVNRRPWHVPVIVGRILGKLGVPLLREEYIRRFLRNRLYSIDKIRRAGWRPKHALGESLVKTWRELTSRSP